MSYRLRLYPYSGGRDDLIGEGTMEVCRARASRKIRRHRNVMEYPVAVLEKGRKWELETGEDAFMIGDNEGVLVIEELPEEENYENEEEDS
ncbi:hypothetical protein SAMN05444166_4165 [Singulisphaera sp. GP187]|uniref:hypothetical protein n=1 Tax=Singulisphaera sp. GP187 TaxID=1882752 RepID=UPI00092A596F|nr:hypothetical protein [Singulisphaera sp. GP187]SIO37091.1 hypothetical protein SAMN05444166_4165 [Singulisphaera sp. GP187]